MEYSHGNTGQRHPAETMKYWFVALACSHMRELRLKEPVEYRYGHGAVLIWDQTENPFPQEFNQGQASD